MCYLLLCSVLASSRQVRTEFGHLVNDINWIRVTVRRDACSKHVGRRTAHDFVLLTTWCMGRFRCVSLLSPSSCCPMARVGNGKPFQLKPFCDSRIVQNCSFWHQYLGYPILTCGGTSVLAALPGVCWISRYWLKEQHQKSLKHHHTKPKNHKHWRSWCEGVVQQ